MDQVTTSLAAGQSAEDRAREAEARPNGRSSTANLAALIAARVGVGLRDDELSMAATALHWGLGIVPAAAYGLLRDRIPLLGSGRGLAFGALLFLANDEAANTALGLAGPPDAYPASSHLRGLVGHLVLGGTIDTLIDVLGG